MRTLVVHLGGIGDFLLTCPAIGRLKEQGSVNVLGQPNRIALALLGGVADALHDYERTEWHSIFSKPTDGLVQFLKHFDRAVVWMRDDGQILHQLQKCGVRDVRVFPGLPPQGWNKHASQYYLETLGMKSASPFALDVEPVVPGYDVLIAPGSGGIHKNWPLDEYLNLAARFQQEGRSIAWILGPAEEKMQLRADVRVLSTMSLCDLACALASARLYVGNDSGISHLAAAAGCPAVVLFGPTDPVVWRPLGRKVVCVKGVPWPCMDEVLDRVKEIEQCE